MKKIIERIKAEETKLGKILAYYVPIALGSTATIVEILTALQAMPFKVPFDIKETIAVVTFIGFVYGILTKKK